MNLMEALLVTTKRNIDIFYDCYEGLIACEQVACLQVVCPESEVSYFERYVQEYGMSEVKVTSEEMILPRTVKSYIIGALGEKYHRAGWYYQQFLKWHYILLQAKDEVLIWDADTVPLKSINFSDGIRCYLTTSREYHQPYFKLINTLFPDIELQEKSFISQHQLIKKRHLVQLCDELGGFNKILPQYIERIMQNVDKGTNSGFSEYETYANYVLARYPSNYFITQRNWFRGGNAIFFLGESRKRVKWLRGKTKFEFVAFEFHRSTIARQVTAILKVCANLKFSKTKKV